MRRWFLILFGLVLVCGPTSVADQLQWNTREVCEEAVVAVKQATWIVSFCSLCDDEPAEIWSVKGVIIVPTAADDLYEVVVSGARLGRLAHRAAGSDLPGTPGDSGECAWISTGIDLAYTYVLADDGALRPLGRILGLPCRVEVEAIEIPEHAMTQAPFGR